MAEQATVFRAAHFDSTGAGEKCTNGPALRRFVRPQHAEGIAEPALHQRVEGMPGRFRAKIVHAVHSSTFRNRSMAATRPRSGTDWGFIGLNCWLLRS